MRPQTFIVNQTLILLHEHYALFMRNHQRWIIGRTQRERERDIAKWREREREKVEGEGTALVFSKAVIFGFDHRPKSTRDILRYRYWSYLHKVISRRLQILKALVWRYFYFPTVFLVLMTSTRITLMFSTSITAFSIMTLSLKGLYVTLSITMLCHCAECHILFTVMLSVIMPNVIMMSVVMPNVIMTGVIALNVEAPKWRLKSFLKIFLCLTIAGQNLSRARAKSTVYFWADLVPTVFFKLLATSSFISKQCFSRYRLVTQLFLLLVE